jgi:hypothetical protein
MTREYHRRDAAASASAQYPPSRRRDGATGVIPLSWGQFYFGRLYKLNTYSIEAVDVFLSSGKF